MGLVKGRKYELGAAEENALLKFIFSITKRHSWKREEQMARGYWEIDEQLLAAASGSHSSQKQKMEDIPGRLMTDWKRLCCLLAATGKKNFFKSKMVIKSGQELTQTGYYKTVCRD